MDFLPTEPSQESVSPVTELPPTNSDATDKSLASLEDDDDDVITNSSNDFSSGSVTTTSLSQTVSEFEARELSNYETHGSTQECWVCHTKEAR